MLLSVAEPAYMSCPRAGAEAGRYFERCMRTAECLYLIIAVSSIYDCVSFTLHTLSHLHATRMDNYIPRREEEGGGAVWNYNSMYKWVSGPLAYVPILGCASS